MYQRITVSRINVSQLAFHMSYQPPANHVLSCGPAWSHLGVWSEALALQLPGLMSAMSLEPGGTRPTLYVQWAISPVTFQLDSLEHCDKSPIAMNNAGIVCWNRLPDCFGYIHNIILHALK